MHHIASYHNNIYHFIFRSFAYKYILIWFCHSKSLESLRHCHLETCCRVSLTSDPWCSIGSTSTKRRTFIDFLGCRVPRSLPRQVSLRGPDTFFLQSIRLIAIRNQVGQYDWLLKQIGKSAAWAVPNCKKKEMPWKLRKNTKEIGHENQQTNPQHQKKSHARKSKKKHVRKFITI